MNESRNRGWWIPGGAVDYGQSFTEAAHRECIEEAGIDVDLKGVLKVDHGVNGDNARMRVIFYAEPKSLEEAHKFKTVPDEESDGARWVTLPELVQIGDTDKNGLRGGELLDWGTYLEQGGHVYPMAMFGKEGGVQKVKSKSKSILPKNKENE